MIQRKPLGFFNEGSIAAPTSNSKKRFSYYGNQDTPQEIDDSTHHFSSIGQWCWRHCPHSQPGPTRLYDNGLAPINIPTEADKVTRPLYPSQTCEWDEMILDPW